MHSWVAGHSGALVPLLDGNCSVNRYVWKPAIVGGSETQSGAKPLKRELAINTQHLPRSFNLFSSLPLYFSSFQHLLNQAGHSLALSLSCRPAPKTTSSKSYWKFDVPNTQASFRLPCAPSVESRMNPSAATVERVAMANAMTQMFAQVAGPPPITQMSLTRMNTLERLLTNV